MSDKLKNTIVLVPGIGLPRKVLSAEYFYGIREYYESQGNTVFIPTLSVLQTIERRARELKKQILKFLPNQKVNIVAHSIGGLSARYMISVLGMGSVVASLTTIGTPHRGSHLVDSFTGVVPIDVFKAINFVFKNIFSSNLRPFWGVNRESMEKAFNNRILDVPGVKYFSVASYIPDPIWRNSFPMFWPLCKYLNHLEGKNDGFVTVESAKWGRLIGLYQGDHFCQIGQPFGLTFYANHKKLFEDVLKNLKDEDL